MTPREVIARTVSGDQEEGRVIAHDVFGALAAAGYEIVPVEVTPPDDGFLRARGGVPAGEPSEDVIRRQREHAHQWNVGREMPSGRAVTRVCGCGAEEETDE